MYIQEQRRQEGLTRLLIKISAVGVPPQWRDLPQAVSQGARQIAKNLHRTHGGFHVNDDLLRWVLQTELLRGRGPSAVILPKDLAKTLNVQTQLRGPLSGDVFFKNTPKGRQIVNPEGKVYLDTYRDNPVMPHISLKEKPTNVLGVAIAGKPNEVPTVRSIYGGYPRVSDREDYYFLHTVIDDLIAKDVKRGRLARGISYRDLGVNNRNYYEAEAKQRIKDIHDGFRGLRKEHAIVPNTLASNSIELDVPKEMVEDLVVRPGGDLYKELFKRENSFKVIPVGRSPGLLSIYKDIAAAKEPAQQRAALDTYMKALHSAGKPEATFIDINSIPDPPEGLRLARMNFSPSQLWQRELQKLPD